MAQFLQTLLLARGGATDPNYYYYEKAKAEALAKVQDDGNKLEHVVPEALKADRDVVLAACQQNARAFKFASHELKADRDVVLMVCQIFGRALEHVSDELKSDKEVVLMACRNSGRALEFASAKFQADKEVVLSACQKTGFMLKYASAELRADKEFVLAACQQDGRALEHVSDDFLKSDKKFVLAACQESGRTLEWASAALKADKDVVLAACKQDGRALQYASADLKANQGVVMAACQNYGRALEFVRAEFKADKDVVLAACRHYGYALTYASDELKADKDVVMTAAASYPDALKLAKGGLNQDKDCLVAANLWDISYESETKHVGRKIVLSTRFSLKPNSHSQATDFAVLLKGDKYIQNHNFLVYSPNAFAKKTCDPEWTRYDWPCRGTYETCQKDDYLKSGDPQPASCWRYSFRHQLGEARESNGFMIQLVEREDRYCSKYQSLGNGQKIETEMANEIGTKVFRVHAPESDLDEPFEARHIQLVASKLREWDENGRTDMSDCVMAFDRDVNGYPILLNNSATMIRRSHWFSFY